MSEQKDGWAGRRVRFTADFNFNPLPTVTIAYKAGMTEYVRRACAEKAVAAGKAEYVTIEAPPPGLAETVGRRVRRRRKT